MEVKNIEINPLDGFFSLFSGGIFHESNSDSEIAFRYAVERVNMHEKSFEFEASVHHVSPIDSFKAERIGD